MRVLRQGREDDGPVLLQLLAREREGLLARHRRQHHLLVVLELLLRVLEGAPAAAAEPQDQAPVAAQFARHVLRDLLAVELLAQRRLVLAAARRYQLVLRVLVRVCCHLVLLHEIWVAFVDAGLISSHQLNEQRVILLELRPSSLDPADSRASATAVRRSQGAIGEVQHLHDEPLVAEQRGPNSRTGCRMPMLAP